MKDIIFYSVKDYELKELLKLKDKYHLDIEIKSEGLLDKLPEPHETNAVCLFVEDIVDSNTLIKLKNAGINLILLRSKGFDNVDIKKAEELGICVKNTDYPQTAIAEHTLALIFALNRKLKNSIFNLLNGDFSLNNLVTENLEGKVVGIIGTGLIGSRVALSLKSLGMKIKAYDLYKNKDLISNGIEYFDNLDDIFIKSDIVSLHCPANQDHKYLIDEKRISQMKRGSMLINTARGSLLDTKAALLAVESGQLSGLGIDVYEYEEEFFYKEHAYIRNDPILSKLIVNNNIIITPHQAFFSKSSLEILLDNTFKNYINRNREYSF